MELVDAGYTPDAEAPGVTVLLCRVLPKCSISGVFTVPDAVAEVIVDAAEASVPAQRRPPLGTRSVIGLLCLFHRRRAIIAYERNFETSRATFRPPAVSHRPSDWWTLIMHLANCCPYDSFLKSAYESLTGSICNHTIERALY